MLKKAIKQVVPETMWNLAHSYRVQLRYLMLWQLRKTVSFERSGSIITFVIVDAEDLIQRAQSKKAFYEEQELNSIASYFKVGGVFVDIGANTGQHSVYFAKLCGASKVMLFEPIAITCKILRENIRLNNLDAVADLTHLGFGLSDKPSRASFSIDVRNLGGTELLECTDGGVQTITGDSVLAGRQVDFVKIDTEGSEIKVLRGLERTIAESRPTIFVEVDNRNLREFETFITGIDYQIEQRHKRYPWNENFLIIPRSKTNPAAETGVTTPQSP